jgi:hypothetical protein
VATGFDGGVGVFGETPRRRLQDNGVHLAFDKALVAEQSREAPRLVHAQAFADSVGHVRKVVRDGCDLVAGMLREELCDPRAASAQADSADRNLCVRLIAAGHPRLDDRDGRCRSGNTRHEMPAAERFRICRLGVHVILLQRNGT